MCEVASKKAAERSWKAERPRPIHYLNKNKEKGEWGKKEEERLRQSENERVTERERETERQDSCDRRRNRYPNPALTSQYCVEAFHFVSDVCPVYWH